MGWTRDADLRAQVQKLWDKGALLGTTVQADALFPLRLQLVEPNSPELAERFDEMRAWVAELAALEPRFRIVRRALRHRVVGSNTVPEEVRLDTPDDALAAIGKQKERRRVAALVQHAAGVAAVAAQAAVATARAGRCLSARARCGGLGAGPPAPRHLPAPDRHRGVDSSSSSCSLLDAAQALLATGTDQDIGVTQATFDRLDLPAGRVFITENEVNVLASPPMADSMVVFGPGYGFDVLKATSWLQARNVYYWGDIDTHGFAILDQLRARLPQTQSLLMDRGTLMAHADHWGDEPAQSLRDLPRLTLDERAVFDSLRDNRLRARVRLEQERIGFGWLLRALAALPDAAPAVVAGAKGPS